MDSNLRILFDRLQTVPSTARKLFCVVVREAYHGPLHPKNPGVATPPEIFEACGLDVDEFYSLLTVLKTAGLIDKSGEYPMEEIRLTSESTVADKVFSECAERKIPIEDVLVSLDMSSLP